VGQTYVPGTGYVDNSGQWRQDYGTDLGRYQVTDPNAAGYVEPWRLYYDDSLRTAQIGDAPASFDPYAEIDPRTQYGQYDQYERSAYDPRQNVLYDRYGRPMAFGNDYSYDFDPRQQQYLQAMMLRQILGMIHNNGGRVNFFRDNGFDRGYGNGYSNGYHGYHGHHGHHGHQGGWHQHQQYSNAPRIQLRLNF